MGGLERKGGQEMEGAMGKDREVDIKEMERKRSLKKGKDGKTRRRRRKDRAGVGEGGGSTGL